NDDDAADDDDAAGGTSYFGSASGYLKAMDGGGECDGDVLIVIDDAGMVVDGEIDCGGSCTITFDGPYAFSEDSFIPDFDCSIGGVTPTFYEFDAWIWGEEGSYAEGSIGAYGETDYFSLSFSAYFGEG
ncbi:MAG: hypothetical protein KDA24_20145, partial [Deltaproteobacteria bacterium]|nr:hypothetical protein [Deltaproteobacteria bacterium]